MMAERELVYQNFAGINLTSYNSNIASPPLCVIFSGQGNTSFHDGKLRSVNSHCRDYNGNRTFFR